MIPQINPIARKIIRKTKIFSDFRWKKKWEHLAAYDSFSRSGNCLTLTRSTVHVTHCVLGWAPTVIGGLVRVMLSLVFFTYNVLASALQKCRFRYPCWSCKNTGTVGWIGSFPSMHLCVSVFFGTRSQEQPLFNEVRMCVYWMIGRVTLMRVLDLDQPLYLLSKWVFVDLLK